MEITHENYDSNTVDAFKQTGDFDKLKFAGLGVFNKDKLVGWLNEDESKGVNYITDKVKYTAESAQIDVDSEMVCNILKEKSIITATVRDGRPEINALITVTYNVSTLTGSLDISQKDNADKANEALEEK